MKAGDIYYNEPKSNYKKVNIGLIISLDPLTVGVYCKLITSGKEFKIYNIKSLAKAIGISDEKARSTISLLEREGYIKRIPLKDERGKFKGYAYEVEALPLPENERSHAGTGLGENGVPRNPTTPKSGYPENTLPLNNRNNINLDNKENKKDNKESDREKTQSEVERKFISWMEKEYPHVCKMKNPLTYDEYMKLIKAGYKSDQIMSKLDVLENRDDYIRKYRSTYLCVRNWLKEDYKKVKS